MNKLNTFIPTTIDEAFMVLDRTITDEDKEYIKNAGHVSLHHTLGRWIRNNWKLWEENETVLKRIFKEMNITHPDDISDYIIKWYIQHLNGNDFLYKEEINEIKSRSANQHKRNSNTIDHIF